MDSQLPKDQDGDFQIFMDEPCKHVHPIVSQLLLCQKYSVVLTAYKSKLFKAQELTAKISYIKQ
jgi:hypothetical protein